MERKKILYIITKGNFGGAQRYVHDLATQICDRYEVVVTIGKNDGNILEEKLQKAGIKTVGLESSKREVNLLNDFYLFLEIAKIISNEKPDVVHLNSSKIGLVGSLSCLYQKIKGQKIKTIFTAHNWAFNESGRSSVGKFVYYLGHFVTLLLSDKTIAVSQKTKRDVSLFPFVKNKIVVIHNGLEAFETLPKDNARKILLGNNADNGQIIISSFSELHKNKAIDIAISSLQMIGKEIRDKIIYSVIGEGEERKNLEQLKTDLGLEKTLVFKGFIDNAKQLLSGVDIFLMPSRNEALPYAILEAGITGKPVIATSVGGIPEIISDMQDGILIHPNNSKEIAEALKYLLANDKKVSEFGEKLAQKTKASFSLKKMVSETVSIYDII
jgi:glycosyltransferase involved in cell wall biosynthesis